MQFSVTALLSLGLATQVLAIPSPIAERAPGPIDVLKSNINLVTDTVNGDLDAISAAIKKSANDVDAQVKLVATLKADLDDIVAQFQAAAKTVATSTTSLATTLTGPEIVALTAIINAVKTLAGDLKDTYKTAESQLKPETLALLDKEIKAVAAALKPFSDPLTVYAAKVQSTGGVTGASAVLALKTAATSLTTAVKSLLASIGL